jgi:hypothetical protein
VANRFAQQRRGMTAIYYQQTSNGNIEYHLIELTTIRETLLRDYKILEKAVLERRCVFDNDCILKLISYLNEIREATLNLFEQISLWQKMYVKAKRPTLLDKDYLVEIITSTEFLNASRIRKHLNFAVMRGNIFMLPLSTGKPKEPTIITPEIMKEVERFSNPNMDRLIAAYTLLQRSLPKKKFQDVISLNRWIQSIWMPNVQISSTLPSLPTSRPLSAPTKSRLGQLKGKSPHKSPLKKAANADSTNQSSRIVTFSEPSCDQLPSHSRSLSQPSIHPSPIITRPPNQQERRDLPLSAPLNPQPSPEAQQLQQSTVPLSSQHIPQAVVTLPSLSTLSLSTSQLREWYLQNHQNSTS